MVLWLIASAAFGVLVGLTLAVLVLVALTANRARVQEAISAVERKAHGTAVIIRAKTDKQRGAERLEQQNGEQGTPLSDLL